MAVPECDCSSFDEALHHVVNRGSDGAGVDKLIGQDAGDKCE